ncbi:Alpha/Beta hydrolase protein [Apodospora peruviana]|uniref:Alpha/Beta hydrolase protein n=1 Tax=Apodospora peruviana TaxID=516989 RepID=A0AAE0IJD2_9PEZI|nr:Alpha/Beta hydrolase protein [Apodospora peruviana]
MASLGNWTFSPYPPFPATVFPNIALWNATSVAANMTYQIQLSWPFEWGTSHDTSAITNKTALTMYVVDGNAMGTTASEAFKRRQPVAFGQPDAVVVSVGYPLTDHVYSFAHRFVDLTPPNFNGSEGLPVRTGADDFLDFIHGALRPWVRETVFPGVDFTRDALFGHSHGGLFVVYAMINDPSMFDTYLSASPALVIQNASILAEVTKRFGGMPAAAGSEGQQQAIPAAADNGTTTLNKPALFITYGNLEQFPARRRTETEEHFQMRRDYFKPLRMTEFCHDLYDRVVASGRARDVKIKEYDEQDHAGVAASAITDGIDYFVDW